MVDNPFASILNVSSSPLLWGMWHHFTPSRIHSTVSRHRASAPVRNSISLSSRGKRLTYHDINGWKWQLTSLSWKQVSNNNIIQYCELFYLYMSIYENNMTYVLKRRITRILDRRINDPYLITLREQTQNHNRLHRQEKLEGLGSMPTTSKYYFIVST